MGRFMPAATISSIIVVLVVGLELVVAAIFGSGGKPVSIGAIGHLLFFLFFLGWPIALIICVGITACFARYLSTTKAPNLALALLVPAFAGGAIMPVVWSVFWGISSDAAAASLMGAIAGMAGGGAFWAALPPRGVNNESSALGSR